MADIDGVAGTRGAGGETHQTVDGEAPNLTTQQGIPVADDQNTLTVGERGPSALEDFHFREKIFHFDHERIPERVVHARGYGAHGYFEAYESLAEITRADPFKEAGRRTPAFVRFSTVAGNKGSSDLARDVRGFAVKLYTQEGNWDLVGNNIPVFFIQDAIKFPDVIHSVKPEPDRGFPQAQSAHDTFWDFASLMPETAGASAKAASVVEGARALGQQAHGPGQFGRSGAVGPDGPGGPKRRLVRFDHVANGPVSCGGHDHMRLEIQQRQTQQAGTDTPVDHPVPPAHDG